MQLFHGDQSAKIYCIHNRSGESFTITGSNHQDDLDPPSKAQVNPYEVVDITKHRQFCASI